MDNFFFWILSMLSWTCMWYAFGWQASKIDFNTRSGLFFEKNSDDLLQPANAFCGTIRAGACQVLRTLVKILKSSFIFLLNPEKFQKFTNPQHFNTFFPFFCDFMKYILAFNFSLLFSPTISSFRCTRSNHSPGS